MTCKAKGDDVLKSIYTPAAGALSQERVLEVIANNLANVNTVGFKGDGVSFSLLDSEPDKAYPTPLPPANYKIGFEDLQYLRGNEIGYVGISDVYRDVTQGPVMQTQNPSDLMIEGAGMFAAQTPEGIRYTRAGSMSISPEGTLMTQAGHPVLGEKGNVVVRGGEFEVNHLGEVYQDGQYLDRLMVYEFSDQNKLERVGQNYFIFNGPPEEIKLIAQPSVVQGSLEGSNVNPIKNLTAMIMAHRSYEAYQKAISNFDQMMEKSSNVIGDVRA